MAVFQEWIFKKEFLEDVNSARFNHATDVKKEKENRFKTIWFMKDLSNILRPNPTKEGQKDRKEEEAEYDIRNLKVLWTACTFFHRFYVFHSFDSHSRFAVAVACLFLASKVEEKPLRLSDHIFLYFRLRKNKILKKSDQEFKDMERDVLLAERILLQTLGFDLNIVHPYQYFRQIIGKDLRSWFSDPDDSKQVLRLATTLLTDSFRATLCLQYPANQMSLALVYLALCILGLKPCPPSNSSSGVYSRSGGASVSAEDTTWLDLFEKDIDEHVLQNICVTLVEMYESGSFPPAEVPYKASHSNLKEVINSQVDALSQRRALEAASSGAVKGQGDVTPPTLDLQHQQQHGVEEYKGASQDDEEQQQSNKRKQLSPTLAEINTSLHSTAELSGSGSKYRTMPPPCLPPSVGFNSSSSPCYDAPTPRSGYRSARPVTHTHVDPSLLLVSSAQSPDLPPPPPDSPMDSAYSTFSQMHAAQERKDGLGGEDTPACGIMDTPTYMPPPPDTPGSMASTPCFDNLPRPGSQLHQLSESIFQNKKPRTDY